jgi:hypothetical protein
VSRFLRTGHHEAVLPARVAGAEFSLRIWIEMQDVVPLLEKLDAEFGQPGQPYCTHVEQLRVAQETLVKLITEAVREHPGKVRRACVAAEVAQRLSSELGIRRVTIYPTYPLAIDQVDLDVHDLAAHLRALLAST